MKEDLKPTQQEIEEANRRQNERFAVISSSKTKWSIAEMLQFKEEILRYEAWYESLPIEQKLKFMVFEKGGKSI